MHIRKKKLSYIFQLYFIWVTGTHRHFEWLLDILREVEEVDVKRVVSIDIFITQFFQNFDLRTAMLVGRFIGLFHKNITIDLDLYPRDFIAIHEKELNQTKTEDWSHKSYSPF